MIVAVTGSRTGATGEALAACREWIESEGVPERAHHGDCRGADSQWHGLMEEYDVPIEIHPCTISSQRCRLTGAIVHPPLAPLVRNRKMVDLCDVLHAFPATPEIVRSGTWATIRYARQVGRPHVIFWPSGEVEEHL